MVAKRRARRKPAKGRRKGGFLTVEAVKAAVSAASRTLVKKAHAVAKKHVAALHKKLQGGRLKPRRRKRKGGSRRVGGVYF